MPLAFKRDKGWKKLEQALAPGHAGKIIRKHMRRATMLNGKVAERQIRESIKSGRYDGNAPLTTALKGGDKPLVGPTAQMFGAITSRAITDLSVFIGILRTADVYNIALAIHQGTAIKVTKKMRGLFFVLWLASNGSIDPSTLSGRAAELWEQMSGGWLPLKPGTKVITIPGRPFIKQAFADIRLRRKVKENWQMALKMGFKEIKATS
jgi:hypothetical protein